MNNRKKKNETVYTMRYKIIFVQNKYGMIVMKEI